MRQNIIQLWSIAIGVTYGSIDSRSIPTQQNHNSVNKRLVPSVQKVTCGVLKCSRLNYSSVRMKCDLVTKGEEFLSHVWLWHVRAFIFTRPFPKIKRPCPQVIFHPAGIIVTESENSWVFPFDFFYVAQIAVREQSTERLCICVWTHRRVALLSFSVKSSPEHLCGWERSGLLSHTATLLLSLSWTRKRK